MLLVSAERCAKPAPSARVGDDITIAYGGQVIVRKGGSFGYVLILASALITTHERTSGAVPHGANQPAFLQSVSRRSNSFFTTA